jgi:hypothetical protein
MVLLRAEESEAVANRIVVDVVQAVFAGAAEFDCQLMPDPGPFRFGVSFCHLSLLTHKPGVRSGKMRGRRWGLAIDSMGLAQETTCFTWAPTAAGLIGLNRLAFANERSIAVSDWRSAPVIS